MSSHLRWCVSHLGGWIHSHINGLYLQSEIYHSTEIPLRWDVSPYISSLLIRWRLRWLCLDKDTRFFYDKGFKIDLIIQRKFIISVGYPSTCFRIPIYSRNTNLETVIKRCSGKIFTLNFLKKSVANTFIYKATGQ